MKALVKSKAEPGLWLEDVAPPVIGINDVLVRVRYTGICGTDVHIYEWDEWAQRTIPVPMTIGQQLMDLQKAKDTGAITDAEFQAGKAKALGGS